MTSPPYVKINEVFTRNDSRLPVRFGPLFYPNLAVFPSEDQRTDLESAQVPLGDDTLEK